MRPVRALVIAGRVERTATARHDADLMVTADSGADSAMRLGLSVGVVVGDLDSVSDEALAWARSQGAEIIEHPTRKDVTDFELALEYACERTEHVHVLASAGGRLDHAMANLAVLASPRWAGVELSATVDSAEVLVVRARRLPEAAVDAAEVSAVRARGVVEAAVGEVVSLLAVGGPARVERTSGLEYPLQDEVLDPGEARGVSNVVVATPVEVEVSDGTLLVIRPGPQATA